jgi:hypothetical protein
MKSEVRHNNTNTLTDFVKLILGELLDALGLSVGFAGRVRMKRGGSVG